VRSCPDNNKTTSFLSSRRASLITKPIAPLVPPIKLAQSVSLDQVDPTASPSTFLCLTKTGSNDSFYDSSGEEVVEGDEQRKDPISQIIRKLSCADEADDVLDDIILKGNKALEARIKGRMRTNSYVREDELQSNECDDNGIRSVLAVHEILTSDIKTIQSLLDDKMVLLRALFDVPEYGEYKDVALWVSTIFLAHEKAMSAVTWALAQEVETAESEHALFRAESMPCALIANFLRLLGRTYLQKILKPAIQKMYQTTKSYEIDINKEKFTKSNASRLRKLANSLLKSVFKSVTYCPVMIREFLYQMLTAVKVKYPEAVALKTVSSFFFLRFVCPAILYPSSCGILEPIQSPSANAQRGLVLAAKILQNLANGGDSEYSAAHMKKINKVVVANSVPMQEFIEKLCRRPSGCGSSFADCVPTAKQYQNAVHDLQKYITDKINSIPKQRPSDLPDSDPLMRLLKLRRALQSYSFTWRTASAKLNPPPTPAVFATCTWSAAVSVDISSPIQSPQTTALCSSIGSEGSGSLLSFASFRDL
jgi:hypothetical protein